MNIIVTGSLGFDYIMNFPGLFKDRIMPDKIHQISLSFLADKYSKQFGGTACNIAYTLKLLGLDPLIVTAAGIDFAPYEAHLVKNHISTKYIKQFSDIPTGSYHVITDKADNQIGAFYMGPMIHHSELSLTKVQEKVELVVIGPHLPKAMVKHVKECRKLKFPFLYDPAFQIDHFSHDELYEGVSQAKILIGNDYEIALIEKKLQLTHEKLLELTPIVITTLGSKGSVIESVKNHVSRITIKAAKPKNTSDPTGAGDAYRSGFLAGYLRGFDLKTCGQMGSVSSVYTVETYGTQTHSFTIDEFCKRYADNFHDLITLI